MKQEIKANFKQATIKNGTANLQFEVLTSAEGFMDVVKVAGSVVLLTVETEQQELPIEEQAEGQTTINNYFVNADTGEITEQDSEVIDVDDDHCLPEGGDE